jgi:hypothetical protein
MVCNKLLSYLFISSHTHEIRILLILIKLTMNTKFLLILGLIILNFLVVLSQSSEPEEMKNHLRKRRSKKTSFYRNKATYHENVETI